MSKFNLISPYNPAGDQPQAIKALVKNLKAGKKHQTLLGVTGSGKTFTIANVIAKVQKPTLVIAHNKTLAAQLASELRIFFPKNAVEYFVSYYDYYQPEAYLPNSDTFIEKDFAINEEIDRLRHAASTALISRKDVIVVSSVSCIYGLGSPEFYEQNTLKIEKGQILERQNIIKRLVALQYVRSEILNRGMFRVFGETYEIVRPDRELIIRIQTESAQVKNIIEYDALTGEILQQNLDSIFIFPAKHHVAPLEVMQSAKIKIRQELKERMDFFRQKGKILELERIKRRTEQDLALMEEIGYCSGIENYSFYMSAREKNQAPYTLVDYFPRDFLTVIDESHVSIPQLRAMYGGDKSRKDNLIEHGFRLPSAYENRPLKFNEFEQKMNQVIFVSATPASYELAKSCDEMVSSSLDKKEIMLDYQRIIKAGNCRGIVEQVVRPTGLTDPAIEIRSCAHQVKNVIEEIKAVVAKGERVLITTLTKKMAEELSDFLKETKEVKSEYLHSGVDTLDRIRILQDLRKGKFDVLVGVNLLREGLDLPEVSLVAILDADKEGFLRSETSLIQTIGRAARNVQGRVILYADKVTSSMQRAIEETDRRRIKQVAYNKKHGITPRTIKKNIKSIIDFEIDPNASFDKDFIKIEQLEDLPAYLRQREKEMKVASKALEFEKAALIRDEISRLRKVMLR